jgi:hypothetical protein
MMTYLEKRFRILPAGVVSKKLIGDRKIANAMRSCNFLEAWSCTMQKLASMQKFYSISSGQGPKGANGVRRLLI